MLLGLRTRRLRTAEDGEREAKPTMHGKCSLLMEPLSYFRNLQTAASNLLHPGKPTSVPTW
ncbi:MAG: hypothetical protein QOJ41_2585 [Acidobacteriaceae bacterium]|jgi:hypothetical protein|nr:hypothetical protein [Acidobacteriaceae bacterium]